MSVSKPCKFCRIGNVVYYLSFLAVHVGKSSVLYPSHVFFRLIGSNRQENRIVGS